jgi:hypothetical protein
VVADGIALIAPYLPGGSIGPRATRSRRIAAGLAAAGLVPRAVVAGEAPANGGFEIAAAADGPLIGEKRDPGMGTRLRVRSALARQVRRVVPVPDAHTRWALAASRSPGLAQRPAGVEAVYAIGAPYSSLVLGALLARRWGVPVIGDLGDPWPIRGIAEARLERWTLSRMAALVVTNEPTAELYRGRIAVGGEIVVAPNGSDITRGREREEPPLFLQLGTLTGQRTSPAAAFEALGRLDREGVIRFRSYGESWVQLDREIAELHLGVLGEEEANELMCRASALLMLASLREIQIPSKAYEIARSDLWGLCVSEIDRDPGAELLRRSGHGVAAPNTVDGVRAAALEIVERLRAGRRPQPTGEHHSWEATVDAVVGVTMRALDREEAGRTRQAA